jgi:hypothetical protein
MEKGPKGPTNYEKLRNFKKSLFLAKGLERGPNLITHRIRSY